ncbi:hypothetical protein FisN_29Lh044 [Fistulifera solaris]|uniref:MICOS complex subunit MIC19 n=1 Tax=Fistulifera solaris TaxID=1519565 RepID=A0A1Z5JLP6_FISSO|nr:hypothetical protein FisN_29Lh044 [Fistulifera solaris]|eukprot:GAX14836.1 hypothetical protein FisN_29Lh044 [Fistulifera solaris]
MGQSSSTANSVNQENLVSGVSLDPELEEAIVRDFSNQSLQEEWDKFRREVIIRRNERLEKRNAALLEAQQRQQANHAAMQERLTALHERRDQLLATFADESVSIRYDIQRLEETYLGVAEQTPPVDYCLGERAHWIDCSKKYGTDMRPCSDYLAALERCVNRTITESI